ncbi:MAG: hypothetical protein Q8N63_00635 [Nanoarchaeota archaeon]|nr:hypothetical protein [Nanoarchaeota archaeon]
MINETYSKPSDISIIFTLLCMLGAGGIAASLLCSPISKLVKNKRSLPLQGIKSVSTRDINSDGLADIVVEQNSGKKTIYYNAGAEYLTADQMEQREIQRIEQSYQEQLKKTNGSYKNAYDGNNEGRGMEK